MESLGNCPDLSQRIEAAAKKIGTSRISQEDSRAIIRQIATELKVNPSISNLFSVPLELSIPEYVVSVKRRLADFCTPSSSATATVSATAPAPATGQSKNNLTSMMEEMTQWQVSNQATVPLLKEAVAKVERKDSDSDESEEEEEEDGEAEKVPEKKQLGVQDLIPSLLELAKKQIPLLGKLQQRQEQQPQLPQNSSADEFCASLLNNESLMNKFVTDTFNSINHRGDGKIEITSTQPLIDDLLRRGFDQSKLHRIISSLLTREFSNLKHLNLSHFGSFVSRIFGAYQFQR